MLDQPLKLLQTQRHDVSKAKVCFVGDREVGKTSLIRRYVQDAFDERYVATLGARVTQVYAVLDEGEAAQGMELVIWDVMGSPGFRELLQEAYFHGANCVVAVCDVTRRASLWQLASWFNAIEAIAEPGVRMVVANKTDLAGDRVLSREELRAYAASHDCEAFEASARTGQGVAEVFKALISNLLDVLPGLEEEEH